jgi:hypothetical protein
MLHASHLVEQNTIVIEGRDGISATSLSLINFLFARYYNDLHSRVQLVVGMREESTSDMSNISYPRIEELFHMIIYRPSDPLSCTYKRLDVFVKNHPPKTNSIIMKRFEFFYSTIWTLPEKSRSPVPEMCPTDVKSYAL